MTQLLARFILSFAVKAIVYVKLMAYLIHIFYIIGLHNHACFCCSIKPQNVLYLKDFVDCVSPPTLLHVQ